MIIMNKYLLWLLWAAVLLTWCASTPTWNVTWLPDVFWHIPSDFDQLLFIEVDDNIIDLLWTQYGDATPVVDEFEAIESVLIWQSAEGVEGESLLFVEGEWVDIAQLAALGLVALDAEYTTKELTPWLQVHGQTSVVDSNDYTWLWSDRLTTDFAQLYADAWWNFHFLSRPTTQGIAWLALQFSSKLDGTIWSLYLWNKLPHGEAKMLFGDGVVTSSNESWEWRAGNGDVPIHVSLHGISDIFWVDSGMIKTFLPLIAGQFLWDSFSLLSDNDIDTFVESLAGSLSLDIVPSIIGMWGRLVVENTEMYKVFETMHPALDGAIKSQMFSWAVIEEVKEANTMSWNTSVPLGTWAENLTLPLISIDSTTDTTSISFMLLDDIPLESQTTTYPWSTLAAATVDFELLTSLMWVEAGALLETSDSTSVDLEIIAVDAENTIRVLLK